METRLYQNTSFALYNLLSEFCTDGQKHFHTSFLSNPCTAKPVHVKNVANVRCTGQVFITASSSDFSILYELFGYLWWLLIHNYLRQYLQKCIIYVTQISDRPHSPRATALLTELLTPGKYLQNALCTDSAMLEYP